MQNALGSHLVEVLHQHVRDHVQREEHELYPAAERVLPPGVAGELEETLERERPYVVRRVQRAVLRQQPDGPLW